MLMLHTRRRRPSSFLAAQAIKIIFRVPINFAFCRRRSTAPGSRETVFQRQSQACAPGDLTGRRQCRTTPLALPEYRI
jgi:hypothetical protein